MDGGSEEGTVKSKIVSLDGVSFTLTVVRGKVDPVIAVVDARECRPDRTGVGTAYLALEDGDV